MRGQLQGVQTRPVAYAASFARPRRCRGLAGEPGVLSAVIEMADTIVGCSAALRTNALVAASTPSVIAFVAKHWCGLAVSSRLIPRNALVQREAAGG